MASTRARRKPQKYPDELRERAVRMVLDVREQTGEKHGVIARVAHELGVDVFTTEDGAGWTAFLRSLVARGLSGVQLVISDAHEGLKKAIAGVLPGASWQRCRTHFVRNLMTRVPKSAQAMVATLVRSIFEQPDADTTWAQHARVVEQLEERFADAAVMLTDAAPDVLAFTAFPKEHWRQIRSNNPPRATQQGTPSAHRRRGDLPQPRGR